MEDVGGGQINRHEIIFPDSIIKNNYHNFAESPLSSIDYFGCNNRCNIRVRSARRIEFSNIAPCKNYPAYGSLIQKNSEPP